MAEQHLIGITVTNWRYQREFAGTESALIRAGIVESSWLPGRPGRNRWSQGVVFNGDVPEFVFGRGSALTYKAKGRPYIRILRVSTDRYSVTRPYRENEAALKAEANKEATAADWQPSSPGPYKRELELCGKSARPADRFMREAYDLAKQAAWKESATALCDEFAEQSEGRLDLAIYAFTTVRYGEIMDRLRNRDDDNDWRGGGRKEPEPDPKPAPTPAAA